MILFTKKARAATVCVIMAVLAFHFATVRDMPESKNPDCNHAFILPAAGLLIAPVIALCGYDIVSDKLVTRTDSQVPRNPETGILLGAETRDLGPLDSPNAVLFVHGFVGAGNNFNYLPEKLADQGWRVRVMRLPGHGTSPRDLEKETPDSLIDAVLDEFDTLAARHEKVAVVGHSMGGTLSSIVSSQRPVHRLVLGAPYFGVTHKWYYLLKTETWIDVAKPGLRWLYKGEALIFVNRKEVKDKIVAYKWVPVNGTIILSDLGDRANSPGILEKISCPVLMLHPSHDDAASYDSALAAYKRIGSTDKSAVILEKSNHHIFWDYEHELVSDEIVRFLGKGE